LEWSASACLNALTCFIVQKEVATALLMSYKHDIFISYRRDKETRTWIKEHFEPLLALYVGFELGRTPVIYIDDKIESGTSCPASLGLELGSSRTLIVLWTGNYLASVWCTEELTQMLVREKEAKLRTATNPHGVIIPAFINDGNRFPQDLSDIQHFEIQKCFNVRMARTSPRAEELAAALAEQAPAIAACIKHAPTWRKSWATRAATKFFEHHYQRVESAQTTVPRFATR
jgi:hypothetical protein